MIQRELQNVSVVSFASGLDAYGQKRQGVSTTRTIEMVVKDYANTIVNDVRYENVEKIGLTKDNLITSENEITIGGINYMVLFVKQASKYYVVYMRKK